MLGVTPPLTAIGTHSQLRLRIPTVGTHMNCPDPSTASKNTDANFTISQTLVFAFAFWIPKSINEGWRDSNHYVAPDGFQFGSLTLVPSSSTPIAKLPSVAIDGHCSGHRLDTHQLQLKKWCV